VNLLLDTSVLVDHLRNDPRAVELLLAANERGDQLWGSVLTRTELIGGMRTTERAATMRLLEILAWVDVTVEIADRAGELRRTYRRSHPGVDVADFVIAASAESVDARLITRNVKHFPMVPGIEPPY
jgi:predicted nucleic acid-binding protein